jgi:hypothetical protein
MRLPTLPFGRFQTSVGRDPVAMDLTPASPHPLVGFGAGRVADLGVFDRLAVAPFIDLLTAPRLAPESGHPWGPGGPLPARDQAFPDPYPPRAKSTGGLRDRPGMAASKPTPQHFVRDRPP